MGKGAKLYYYQEPLPHGENEMRVQMVVGIMGLVLLMLLLVPEARTQRVGVLPGGCASRFARLDTNRDGKLTLEEFKAVPHLGGYPEGLFRVRDLNQDGVLSGKEFCAGKAKRKRPPAKPQEKQQETQ